MKPFIRLASVLLLALSVRSSAAPDGRFDGPPSEGGKIQPAPAEVQPAKGKPIAPDQRLWIVATAPDSETRTAVADAGICIEEVLGDKAGGIGTAKMAERLRRRGIKFTAVPLERRFRPEDFPAEDAAYHNYARTRAELERLAGQGRGLVSLFSIGRSTLGKDLWALRLNTTESGTQKSSKPGIVFMGTHHAREHLSTEVPLLLAKYLLENREKPEIAALLSTRDIYFIPMVNPDGAEYDIDNGRYHMHRKNMRDNGDGTLGVDLNRNYGFHWGEGGASPDTDSDIYRGPSPFSEPETQAIKTFIEERKGNVKILLTYHSFSELILYPWGHSRSPIPDSRALAAFKAMANAMGKMTGYKPEQSSDLYIASGDTTDWAWGALGVFAFTFELTPKSMWDGGFYPGAGAIATTFQNNIRPALYLIGLADNPYRASESALALSEARSVPSRSLGGL